MEHNYVVRMEHISKSFVGVPVLKDVSLSIKAGEVRALLGENGAGKSTLIKILGGIYSSDSGKIWIREEEAHIENVADAKEKGIAIIHQEIALIDALTVGENIFMGREFVTKMGTVDFKRTNEEARKVLESLGLSSISPETLVSKLSISQKQLVEIARAISGNASVIVMDEPTASLTDKEIDHLFERIDSLKKQNVAIIYISHRMEEIERVADSITILRDGEHIITDDAKNLDYPTIIRHMVGRELTNYYAKKKIQAGETVLRVENLSTAKVKNISFELRKGEVLGITGLMGAGRTELMHAIYGLDPIISGKVILEGLNGQECSIKSPRDAINYGIALVPEERKRQGLVLNNTIRFNMTLPVLDEFIHFIHVNVKKEDQIIDKYIKSLSIKMASTRQLTAELSGGNQQKIVISKWLAKNPKILILDEPTRGIDVGAKSEIYHLIDRIASEGVAIIMISSELPEVLNVSSRILVMHEGMISGEFDNELRGVTQEDIMLYATGGK